MTKTLRCIAHNDMLHAVQGKLGITEQRQHHFMFQAAQGVNEDPHWPHPLELISMSADTFTVGGLYAFTIHPVAAETEAVH